MRIWISSKFVDAIVVRERERRKAAVVADVRYFPAFPHAVVVLRKRD